MKYKKDDIVEVKINNIWIIKITKIFKKIAKGKILKTGQLCDFEINKIVKKLK